MLRNQLGSFSAMSLAANPVALPVLAVAAGVAVTVGASIFAYREFKDYEEKKHREEIEAVNRLYKTFLARIYISDYDDIQGFPPIFKLTDDKKSAKADSMHMTDDEIEAIGNKMPETSDIALSPYRQSILSAILKLKEYYFSRSARRDITAGVLAYLLYMLETKCLTFEGYDYDIAYINALAKFINAYASDRNREKTQHFSRLQPVFGYLLSAKQALEKHKEALSLVDMISELKSACEANSNHLLREFVKLTIRNKHWDLVKTVAMDELAQGLLRRKYIHAEIKGLVIRNDDEEKLPDSIFRLWIMSLANFYLQTLDPNTNPDKMGIQSPQNTFVLPDLSRLDKRNEGKKNPNDSKEQEVILVQLKAMRHVFEDSENFITTKLDQISTGNAPKFIPVTDNVEMIARAKVLVQFASLIHELMSLQYFATHLLKSTQQLGEIYVKSPEHFCRIFWVLESLCNKIKDGIVAYKNAIVQIEQSNRNTMQLETKQVLPEQVKDSLNTTYASISRLGTMIKDYRNKVAKGTDPDEPTMASVKHEMFEAAQLLTQIYQLPPMKQGHAKPLTAPVARSSASILVPAAVPAKPAHAAAPPNPAASPAQAQMREKPEQGSNAHEQLGAILEEINAKIIAIKETEKPADPDAISLYQNLLKSLQVMQWKCLSLRNEEHKSPDREMKCEKLTQLTLKLCQMTSDYLALPKAQRDQHSGDLANEIHMELINPENDFIDQHSSCFSRTAYKLTRSSMFSTDTRKKLSDVENKSAVLPRA